MAAAGAGALAYAGLVERNARLVDLPDDAMHAGQEVHALIARIADNAWAQRVHDQTGVQMARYRAFTNESGERRHAALAEHRDILAAAGYGPRIGTGSPHRKGAISREEGDRLVAEAMDSVPA